MRILFLGNHTVGVCSLSALLDSGATIAGVVAHPPDPEEGVVFQSVHDFAREHGLKTIRGRAGDDEVQQFVQEAAPDLLWTTDYRYLLPPRLIDAAAFGGVNLHPSLLPRYRGRAPINWAIIHGETELGLTAHVIEEGADTGDIIDQMAFAFGPDDDVSQALEALYPLYREMTARVAGFFMSGSVPRRPQDESQASTFPRRRPEDGRIDWETPARAVHDLVRAVTRPYPGAFGQVDGRWMHVWRTRVVAEAGRHGTPGTKIDELDGLPLVATGDGAVLLTEVSEYPERVA